MTSVPGQTLCGQWGLALWAAEYCKKTKGAKILLEKKMK